MTAPIGVLPRLFIWQWGIPKENLTVNTAVPSSILVAFAQQLADPTVKGIQIQPQLIDDAPAMIATVSATIGIGRVMIIATAP